MICKQCGTEFPDTGKFCPGCGTPNQPAPRPQPQPQTYQSAPQQTYQPTYAPQPARPAAASAAETDTFFAAHPEYRPMSAWAYFGHSVLYSLPIIGFIFLIIHSCKSNYIARRNYARSFWCALIVAAIVFVICAVIAFAMGESIFYLIEHLS